MKTHESVEGIFAGLAETIMTVDQTKEDIANLLEIVTALQEALDEAEQTLTGQFNDYSASAETEFGSISEKLLEIASRFDAVDLKLAEPHSHDLEEHDHPLPSHDHPLQEHSHTDIETELAQLRSWRSALTDLEQRLTTEIADRKKADSAPHAKQHLMGKDIIPIATEKTRGLMSPTHVKKLKALPSAAKIARGSYGPAPSADSKLRTYSWVIANPAVGGIAGPKMLEEHAVVQIDSYTTAATSVAFNIENRTTIGSAGTDIMTAEQTAVVAGAVTDLSGVTWKSLQKDSWLWLDISNVTGTPGQIIVTLTTTVA